MNHVPTSIGLQTSLSLLKVIIKTMMWNSATSSEVMVNQVLRASLFSILKEEEKRYMG